jgi:hypothetical protein
MESMIAQNGADDFLKRVTLFVEFDADELDREIATGLSLGRP